MWPPRDGTVLVGAPRKSVVMRRNRDAERFCSDARSQLATEITCGHRHEMVEIVEIVQWRGECEINREKWLDGYNKVVIYFSASAAFEILKLFYGVVSTR
jgi:hypothetical protein